MAGIRQAVILTALNLIILKIKAYKKIRVNKIIYINHKHSMYCGAAKMVCCKGHGIKTAS